MLQAFIAEAVFTFIFVLVALGATDKKKGAGKLAGLVIGLTLVLVHIVCIPITGTSVNPARSIGPALFEGGGAISQLWLFIVAPLTGGLASAKCGKPFLSIATDNDEGKVDDPETRFSVIHLCLIHYYQLK